MLSLPTDIELIVQILRPLPPSYNGIVHVICHIRWKLEKINEIFQTLDLNVYVYI